MQAKFLIPMAVSLAYGIMFSTIVTLFLVPASYAIVEDLRRLTSSRRSTNIEGPSNDLKVESDKDTFAAPA